MCDGAGGRASGEDIQSTTLSHSMIRALTEMVHELLRELENMPAKITDPNWIESLDEDTLDQA